MELSLASTLIRFLKKHINSLHFTGSFYRNEPFINDIDIITIRPLDKVIDDFYDLFGAERIDLKKNGKRYKSFIFVIDDDFKIQIDIWKVNDKTELFFKKTMMNLDKGHNIYYRNKARARGMILSDEGLFKDDRRIDIKTKKELKDILRI